MGVAIPGVSFQSLVDGDHGRQSGWDCSIEDRPAAAASPWSRFDIASFTDGAKRRVESGTFPLAHGIPRDLGSVRAVLEGMGLSPAEVKRRLRKPRSILAMAGRSRISRLKGYGNAIVPQVAALFIRAFMEEMGISE